MKEGDKWRRDQEIEATGEIPNIAGSPFLMPRRPSLNEVVLAKWYFQGKEKAEKLCSKCNGTTQPKLSSFIFLIYFNRASTTINGEATELLLDLGP